MRGSGLLLVVLVFGHLFVNLMIGEGITQIDFAFVAGKWANPFWQVWDLRCSGWRCCTAATACARSSTTTPTRPNTRFALKTLLYFGTASCIVLGTLVIFTFDPCIDPKSTLDVCRIK